MSLFSWYRLPRFLGLLRLNTFRERMRRQNLYSTQAPYLNEKDDPPALPTLSPEQLAARSADGTFNDLSKPRMGCAGMRFGRNIPLNRVVVADEQTLMTPSPRVVSRDLMTRDRFIPATSLNLLAASWIQFQVHDWFSHGENDESQPPFAVPLPANDPWPKPQMLVKRTHQDPTRPTNDADRTPSFVNTETHWWDASQLYGSNLTTQQHVRSFEHGKLKLGVDGLLPVDPHTGIDVTGVSGNWWVGLSMLHTLFTLEHNAICDRLRQEFPAWTDEQLFLKARLVNAALMAKIHTIEWTTAILAHPTVQAGLNNNWTQARNTKQEHHAAPYSMTEEFVAVYRMHPLMPDEFTFRSLQTGKAIETRTLPQVADRHARELMTGISLTDLFYSFGTSHPGAITLHNYPYFLQNLERDGEVKMDLAAVDVLRDRERGVPRYNEFRKLMGLDPVKKFEDLSNNPKWNEEIQRVYYNDINLVDLQVGMFAEPLIEGMGFSETAFRVFLLMASRRLQSDRFFTDDYDETTYTKAGLQWVEETTMRTVLARHLPQLKPILDKLDNAFAPWPGTSAK
ncbi:MAG TPA: peroxidase family protein [Blastocatellia bacterium]|nr:peroxidase family protein [Blastocatellia bacterium]HMX27704.1 peroxidase family protein [Blastocatellia bacterium]HNG33276.1 peroxidase family protein [Blastocatellia bacterium]